jgi:hypothetical protein
MTSTLPKDAFTSIKSGSRFARIEGQGAWPDMPLEDLGALVQANLFVKVVAETPKGSEAFWVNVIEVYGTPRGLKLVGDINNALVATADHGLMLGDLIEFRWINVREIMTAPSDRPTVH